MDARRKDRARMSARIEVCHSKDHRISQRRWFAKVFVGDTFIDTCAHESANSAEANKRAEQWIASLKGQYRIALYTSNKEKYKPCST
jgi:hypothetical protein